MPSGGQKIARTLVPPPTRTYSTIITRSDHAASCLRVCSLPHTGLPPNHILLPPQSPQARAMAKLHLVGAILLVGAVALVAAEHSDESLGRKLLGGSISVSKGAAPPVAINTAGKGALVTVTQSAVAPGAKSGIVYKGITESRVIKGERYWTEEFAYDNGGGANGIKWNKPASAVYPGERNKDIQDKVININQGGYMINYPKTASTVTRAPTVTGTTVSGAAIKSVSTGKGLAVGVYPAGSVTSTVVPEPEPKKAAKEEEEDDEKADKKGNEKGAKAEAKAEKGEKKAEAKADEKAEKADAKPAADAKAADAKPAADAAAPKAADAAAPKAADAKAADAKPADAAAPAAAAGAAAPAAEAEGEGEGDAKP